MGRLILAALLLAVALPGRPADAAGGRLVFISPLPFGVDAYFKLVRSGVVAAGAALHMPTQVFESTDPETRSENVRAAIRAGATIIVATGFEFADIVPDDAADNPAIRFLLIDECPPETAANLFCLVFREQEANFLAGAEAGLTTRTGKVGTVAATDIPFEHRYGDAFAAGAHAVRPDVQVFPTLWVGGDTAFSDPVRAQSQAAALLSSGADRVFAASSAGNGGIYKEVAGTPGALALGTDVNQCGQAPGHVLDSAVKHVDLVTTEAIEATAAGTQPAQKSYGLKEGGVGLAALEPGAAASQCTIVAMPDVLARLARLRDDIVAGRVQVADPMQAAH